VTPRHTVVAARLTSDKGKATLMDLLKKAVVGAVIAIFIIAALFIVVIMIEIITEHYRHAAAVAVMMIGGRDFARADAILTGEDRALAGEAGARPRR
jgi:hypothetical protein